MKIFGFTRVTTFLLVINKFSTGIFTEADGVYNETEARVLFELVAAVHNPQPQFCLKASFPNPKIRPKLINHFFVRCDHLNSDCTFALFELPAKIVVVAIRGTRTMSQFFFETMSAFIPDTSFRGLGEINYYFSMTFKAIWPDIRDILLHSNYTDHDVIFTGHSLGGSLAALSAFETVLSDVRNSSQVKVVTLAEPRTGNLVFARNFDKTVKYSFRIINGIDVLAHLPPCHKDYRFWPRVDLPCDPRSRDGPYHHSREIWYPDGMNKTSKYVVCNESRGEDPFCSDRVHVTVANMGKGITDHRKYFGKMVSQYGNANCNQNRTFDENEGFLGKVKLASELINKVI